MKKEINIFNSVRNICVAGAILVGLIVNIGSGLGSSSGGGNRNRIENEGTQLPTSSEITITSDPKIAMDGSGNAIVVANREWTDGIDTQNGVYYNMYHQGQGWDSAI